MTTLASWTLIALAAFFVLVSAKKLYNAYHEESWLLQKHYATDGLVFAAIAAVTFAAAGYLYPSQSIQFAIGLALTAIVAGAIGSWLRKNFLLLEQFTSDEKVEGTQSIPNS